jgi:hypothetical protein
MFQVGKRMGGAAQVSISWRDGGAATGTTICWRKTTRCWRCRCFGSGFGFRALCLFQVWATQQYWAWLNSLGSSTGVIALSFVHCDNGVLAVSVFGIAVP